jgi:uncharacterized coiled-coil protein SlyX
MNEKNSKDPKIDELERRINEVASKIDNLNVSSSQESNQIKAGEEKFKELVQALKEAQPSWEKDGGGVKGTPTTTPDTQSTLPDIPKFDFKETKQESGRLEDDPEVTQEVLQGGGGSSCIGLNLYTRTTEGGDSEVWVGAGTIAGQVPAGFDPAEGKLVASNGSGYVWAEINIRGDTGEITSVEVDSGGSVPEDNGSLFYYTMGYYEYTGSPPTASVTNYGCGSLSATICRNWFASASPYYGVTIFRS